MKELREYGVKADIDVVELDISSDESINKALKYVKQKHGKLDGECPQYPLAHNE